MTTHTSADQADVVESLKRVSTSTITTVLLKRGIRNVWMEGTKPIRSSSPRLVGPAFTLRFVPGREDLATPESWSNPVSTRTAIEDMPEGCIAVAGALGIDSAGIFGDILCQRMRVRNVGGLVTDGVVRDISGVLGTGLPIWCRGAAAPPSIAGLTFVGWNEPVGCGGVAVFPGDIIVADDDGAIVVPAAISAEVAVAATQQETSENWIMEEVKGGHPLPGLYPMNAENRARFEQAQPAKGE